jgi:hypothetical protein
VVQTDDAQPIPIELLGPGRADEEGYIAAGFGEDGADGGTRKCRPRDTLRPVRDFSPNSSSANSFILAARTATCPTWPQTSPSALRMQFLKGDRDVL